MYNDININLYQKGSNWLTFDTLYLIIDVLQQSIKTVLKKDTSSDIQKINSVILQVRIYEYMPKKGIFMLFQDRHGNLKPNISKMLFIFRQKLSTIILKFVLM